MDEAIALLSALDDRDVLWVGPEETRFVRPPAGRARALLGRSFQVVVWSLHDGFDPDVLGQVHGFVWGGGRLVLRLPPRGEVPRSASLAVSPYGAQDVGTRTWDRLERWLVAHPAMVSPHPVAPAPLVAAASSEQERLVSELIERFAGDEPAVVVLTADRGRGKSAALGRAIRAARARRPLRVLVTAAEEDSVHELVRFAGPDVRWTPPVAALEAPPVELLVIDEAARLAIPWLHRLLAAHPTAVVALATTTRGYEGTGRGFSLRFVDAWRGDRPLVQRSLAEPIRFAADDPLEAWALGVLGLEGGLEEEDRDLRDVFGLLAEAHYRTTPSDLQRILDAPNLALHTIREAGRVRAVSVVAREGGLSSAQCAAMYSGAARVRGHVLPDTLIAHAGEVEAGQLRIARSVRIATDPTARRRGWAARLVEEVHASYDVDLFGTVFGATVDLVRFRRALGYEVVRLGSSRGQRTGEPAVVMLRPVSAAAHALAARLRAVLARELACAVALHAAEGEPLEDELVQALREGLPPPAPLPETERDRIVFHWLEGPRPYEAAAYALRAWIEAHPELARDPLVAAKIVHGRGWRAVTRDLGLPSVPAAMRALRRRARAAWVSARPLAG